MGNIYMKKIKMLLVGLFSVIVSLSCPKLNAMELLVSPEQFVTSMDQTINTINETIDNEMKAQISALGSEPYAIMQAIKVPVNSKVLIIGDLHGDVVSLRNNLKKMSEKGCFSVDDNEKLANDFYLVITGDYADRGYHSLEVWQIVMRLKQKNPDHVFLLRGNHDTETQANKPLSPEFLLMNEIQTKYPDKVDLVFESFKRLWEKLPQAMFIGVDKHTDDNGTVDYMLCCHAALELNLKDKIKQLLDKTSLGSNNVLQTMSFTANDFVPFEAHVEISDNPLVVNSFLWSDIAPRESKILKEGRLTKGVLEFDVFAFINKYFSGENWSIKCIMRGHQHDFGGVLKCDYSGFIPMMREFPVTINDNDVFTFMSTPEGLQLLEEDAFGMVELRAINWILTPYIETVNPPLACSRLDEEGSLREQVDEHILRFVVQRVLGLPFELIMPLLPIRLNRNETLWDWLVRCDGHYEDDTISGWEDVIKRQLPQTLRQKFSLCP